MSKLIKVTVGGVELTYSSDDGMLTAWAKKKGIDIERHCGEGYCGACVCKIKSDKETDVSKLVETHTEIIACTGDDEIATCQSTPKQDITLILR
jgi:ferredoxin